jgi:type I restriction enzyme R subunit
MNRGLLPESYDSNLLRETLENLGWKDGKGFHLGKETFLSDFVYGSVFEERFKKINETALQNLNEKERKEVLDQVKTILKVANEKEILRYLKDGIDIPVKKMENKKFLLIDFEHPDVNVYFYGSEIRFPAQFTHIKPDFTLFINGIPLVIIEVEESTRLESWQEDGVNQIKRYEIESPDLFKFVQLGICYADKRFFVPTFPNRNRKERELLYQPWKVEREDGIKEDITDLIKPQTLLNVIRWYTFFKEEDGELKKIIARYNQYRAAEKAFDRISKYLDGTSDERKGLIWHWQGSGKTYTMFFIANKFFEKFFDKYPLVFFVLDRRYLQGQIVKKFFNGIDTQKFNNYLKVVEDVEELKTIVETIKRSEYTRGITKRGVYVVLLQKFRREEFDKLLEKLGEEYLLSKKEEGVAKEEIKKLGGIQKREVLLLIDEAHRSQYGILASVMKNIFRNSIRLAFTGTPIFEFEKNTFSEFSNPPKEWYLDCYFIKDSQSDGFTVPILYDIVKESGALKIKLNDEEIKRFIDEWIKMCREKGSGVADEISDFFEGNNKALTVTSSEMKRHLNEIQLVFGSEEWLRESARYIAKRLKEDTENFRYKAMVVVLNRKSCVLFKKYLDEELKTVYGTQYKDTEKWTEVVMTYEENDTNEILNYKLELIKRRGESDLQKINSDIQEEFIKKENPKILIVTEMLISGFDAPKLKVMYLNKPLFEHRLLQAIARVNRAYSEGMIKKEAGLIVDFVGLLPYMIKSLREYQLIAEKKIELDLEENLLVEIEKKVNEFKESLKDIKKELSSLKLNNQDLSIDLDEIKNKRKRKDADLNEYLNQIDSKISIIALHKEDQHILNLLTLMKESISSFDALGSNEEKMDYAEDVEILKWIYSKMLYYIKGKKRLPKEFWNDLVKNLSDKILVGEFYTLASMQITNDILKRVIKECEMVKGEELISERKVADAYHMLRWSLEENPNPIYEGIKERLEEVRKKWILRKIQLLDAVNDLNNLLTIKITYDEKILSKPIKERIVETIKFKVQEKFHVQPKLQNFENYIDTPLNSTKIVETHIKGMKTNLLKDLFKEVKGDIKELKEFVDKIVDEYVIPEIKNGRK